MDNKITDDSIDALLHLDWIYLTKLYLGDNLLTGKGVRKIIAK